MIATPMTRNNSNSPIVQNVDYNATVTLFTYYHDEEIMSQNNVLQQIKYYLFFLVKTICQTQLVRYVVLLDGYIPDIISYYRR